MHSIIKKKKQTNGGFSVVQIIKKKFILYASWSDLGVRSKGGGTFRSTLVGLQPGGKLGCLCQGLTSLPALRMLLHRYSKVGLPLIFFGNAFSRSQPRT